jgi:glycolate oxidase
LDQVIIEQFKKIVGEEQVLLENDDLFCYSYDATQGIPTEFPDVVVMPTTTEQVSEVVKICAKNKIPIYSKGAGTNLSGGTVPLKKGVVLSLLKMAKIIEIDTENHTCRAEAGVVIQDLDDAVAKFGLLYPPDPATVKTATMGGSVAENAGGLRGLKYGVTKDFVMGVKVVLADGSIVQFGNKCIKDVSGYNMKAIFVASEGMLGIMTEVLVKLVPRAEDRKAMMVTYDKLDKAAETIKQIIANKIIPATMEIMDNTCIKAVEEFSKIGLPVDAEALLLIEVDGWKEAVEREAARVVEICNECGAAKVDVAQDMARREALWAARRAAIPAQGRLRPSLILKDATVPRSELAGFLRDVQEISKKHNVLVGNFGHAGDGNLHPTILTNVDDPEEMKRVDALISDIFDAALARGGTLSGEHGIGVAKAKYLPRQFNADEIGLMKKLKAAFDPDNLLNPGKMFV